MELAKILPDGTVDLRHCTSKECEKYKELKQEGFLEFISETPPPISPEQNYYKFFWYYKRTNCSKMEYQSKHQKHL